MKNAPAAVLWMDGRRGILAFMLALQPVQEHHCRQGKDAQQRGGKVDDRGIAFFATGGFNENTEIVEKRHSMAMSTTPTKSISATRGILTNGCTSTTATA